MQARGEKNKKENARKRVCAAAKEPIGRARFFNNMSKWWGHSSRTFAAPPPTQVGADFDLERGVLTRQPGSGSGGGGDDNDDVYDVSDDGSSIGGGSSRGHGRRRCCSSSRAATARATARVAR